LTLPLFQSAQHAGVTTKRPSLYLKSNQSEIFHVVANEKLLPAIAMSNATGDGPTLTQFDVAGKEKWLGLKAHFTELSPPQSVDLYFFAGGYCGVTPVGSNSVNACAMVRADVAHTLEDVFAKEPHSGSAARAWQPLFPTVTTSPLYFASQSTESDGMLLAGDSAGFIDPFAGDGISLALQSGSLAAESISGFVHDGCSLQPSAPAIPYSLPQAIYPGISQRCPFARRALRAPMGAQCRAYVCTYSKCRKDAGAGDEGKVAWNCFKESHSRYDTD